MSLVNSRSAHAGCGGNVLEIKARSVLNVKQPVSKGLVLTELNWRHKDQINLLSAPSTESKLSQRGQVGGSDEPRCTRNDAARFRACRRARPEQTSLLESCWRESFPSALKSLSKLIPLFQEEGKFCPDGCGVHLQLFRGSSSCYFQRRESVTLILAFFLSPSA